MTDWTDPDTFGAALDRATTLEKGNYFEAFAEGDRIEHDAGIRLTRHGNDEWLSRTLNHDPAYWRTDAARERGFDEPPVHPDYLVACTMGPSVEDLSEKGGYFLGRDDVTVHEPAVYPGTELHVESEVLATRESSSRPDYGIVTWETRGVDADTGEALLSYERTNMVPRREPLETDGREAERDGRGSDADDIPALPDELIAPDGPAFGDFRRALDRAADRDAAVAYRHERGRTMDAELVSGLPLATLNTAKQHHDANRMADSPSGGLVAYGDVTRSVALAHARSDELTHRELGYDDERFHDFVTPGDTVYGFTRVLDADRSDGPPNGGRVRFQHIAFNQHDEPVYSGIRTALVRGGNSTHTP
ncbi:2-methylfumaryl-CoA hydratase [Halostella salina]|uniref:2-methylfumaryl-CoA hydratase n=1 Tax=Halostella salina TaxID=1547897 RepID=UPI000EF7E756|nr:2-methylfumaryl-CoA hydratase [Halostella salina]